MKPTNFPGRKQKRIEEGEVRKAERAKRTPQEQIAMLDRMFGVGKGAARERARLLRGIEAAVFAEEAAAQAKAHAEQIRLDKAAAKAAKQ